jgi:hypothetical protein
MVIRKMIIESSNIFQMIIDKWVKHLFKHFGNIHFQAAVQLKIY